MDTLARFCNDLAAGNFIGIDFGSIRRVSVIGFVFDHSGGGILLRGFLGIDIKSASCSEASRKIIQEEFFYLIPEFTDVQSEGPPRRKMPY